MAEDLLRYDILTQNALRGVVREALTRTRDLGEPPGEHHFYITFRTDDAGVEISNDLRKTYEEEMTIVLQHRFWDLTVDQERFSVVLTFQGKPETLVVPFSAIVRFFDPSVQFGLRFDLPKDDAAADSDASAADSEPAADAADEDEPGEGRDADVVSLDQFRKK